MEGFGTLVREAIGCHGQRLKGGFRGSLTDRSAENSAEWKPHLQRFGRTKKSDNNAARGQVCDNAHNAAKSLHSDPGLGICMRLNLKRIRLPFWWRKFQDLITLSLWHGYHLPWKSTGKHSNRVKGEKRNNGSVIWRGKKKNTWELMVAAMPCAEKETAMVRASPLKRSSPFCTETLGKVPWGQDCSQPWLQLVKEESLKPSLLLEGGSQGISICISI